MARGKAKNKKSVQKADFNKLKVTDVLCPICRTIFIEPVTLPCDHRFCYACFKDTMEHANLVCPLCRLRVGAWFRAAKKDNKLVDDQFWNTIKIRFSSEIEDKFKGIDTVDDAPVIIVANPGEIRKEYEKQKQQDEEDYKRRKAAEEKASAELIKKMTADEEYRQAIENEKLRVDQELARKLADQLNTERSKLNLRSNKKNGPMDKFIKGNESTNNFANKEYTCRVLCLNKTKSNLQASNIYKTAMVPVLQKKIQHLKKFLENDTNSTSKDSDSGDNGDVIESEFKFYFKPIQLHKIANTNGKTALKIPTKRCASNGRAKILPPSGNIHIYFDNIKSAFARFSFAPNGSDTTEKEQSTGNLFPLKRKYSGDDYSPTKKRGNGSIKILNDKNQKSVEKPINSCESPPFLGFDNKSLQLHHCDKFFKKSGSPTGCKPKGNVVCDSKSVIDQEKADFEFAKKLQEQLNHESVVTTRSRKRHIRQVTLDEMLMV